MAHARRSEGLESSITRAQMHELRRIISLAIQNGDLPIALKEQIFLFTCFGYADIPTLTHENMTDRSSGSVR